MRDNIGGGALTETTLLILLAVCGTPRHGYGILQFIRQATGKRVVLGAGTLYGALSTLEKKGWIAPAEEKGGKKEYLLTAAGREAVDRELERLRAVTALAERITGGNASRGGYQPPA